MLTLHPRPVEETPQPVAAAEAEVMLADGRWCSLEGLTSNDLHMLQWEQEQKFANAIRAMPPASPERTMVTGQAYDTICTILAAQQTDSAPLTMGLDQRYVRLVLEVLHRQIHRGIGQPHLFEVGHGSGELLREVREHGFPISGLEVSTAMHEAAVSHIGEKYASRLLLGDLRGIETGDLPGRPSLVYWNDVLEHICPDEVASYLEKIHELLMPGGSLITISPNWLLRPSDVTGDFCPPRTEACGLHMNEYRLSEVTRLLKQSGFRGVSSPLVVVPRRIFLAGGGGRLAKQLLEPVLERLPVRFAHLMCRGLGLSCTIARKRG